MDNQNYQDMLEMENLSTVKVAKKKRNSKKEAKEQLIEQVNENIEKQQEIEVVPELQENSTTIKPKNKKKLNVIGIELCMIAVLILGIVLSTIILPQSAIREFFVGVFASETETVDKREYSDFTLQLPTDNNQLTSKDGTIYLSASGSVYSPASGKVESVLKGEDGKFDVVISHNDNFKTVINNLEFFYLSVGNDVYTTLPIGYGNDKSELYFMSNDQLLTCWKIDGQSIVWEG